LWSSTAISLIPHALALRNIAGIAWALSFINQRHPDHWWSMVVSVSYVHACISCPHEKKASAERSFGGSHFVPFAPGLQTDCIPFFFTFHRRPVKKGNILSGLQKVTTGKEIGIWNLIRILTKCRMEEPFELNFNMRSLCSNISFWYFLKSDRLTLKSDKYFFVGYPRKTIGYYFYNKAEGKVFVAHNGVFMEKGFLSKGVSGSKVQLEEI
jgi:hypothetical protein